MMFKKDYTHLPVVLEAKDLSVSFRNGKSWQTPVNRVNFKLYEGETLGIVGESGSGKTLTSLSVIGLLSSAARTSGELLFDSQRYGKIDLLKIPIKRWRNIRGSEISMIFQEPMSSLNPVFSCGEQVIEAILRHEKVSVKQARKRTLALFDQVRLPTPSRIFKSYPHEISGGQKQRVMIAMALACKPSVLIADEPTTALDVTVQAKILELLQDLREDLKTSILFITHDLGVVGQMSDQIMVMKKGVVVEQNTVWNIFSNPRQPYTKGLLACRPRLYPKLKHLPVVHDFLEEPGETPEKTKKAKYQSVGEAIIMNAQTDEDLRKEHKLLITQAPILKVVGLKKYFPVKKKWYRKEQEWVRALDEVSFEVYPGETLGLVGESGCGKSTLARCLLRLIAPTAGTISFQDRDITQIKAGKLRPLRKDIQIIFQDPYASLNPRITIGESIVEPMRVHKIFANNAERKDAAIDLLEQVDLSSTHFNRYPHEFSGGQRQRICIARTLALQPKFIICDESVSALDVSIQAQVLNLLNALKKKYKLTYIFISHDLAVVKFLADRIMVMNGGKIEEISFGEDIYAKPKTAYTQTLVSSIPKGDLQDIHKALLRRNRPKKTDGKAGGGNRPQKN